MENRFRLNMAASAIHELANALHALASDSREGMAQDERRSLLREGTETVLLLLAPFAPYIVEELWDRLGRARSVFDEPWPAADPAALTRDEVVVVVQVDGIGWPLRL